MSAAAARRVALVAALALAACNGPLPFLAGGKLGGASAPVPAGWSTVDASGTAQIETRPEDPYSVNLVYTVLDGRMYVNAGDTETRWVEHIEANPDVRLRIDGTVYDLRAERVTERAEIAAFGAAWTGQSMFRRDPATLDPVFVYRLVSR